MVTFAGHVNDVYHQNVIMSSQIDMTVYLYIYIRPAGLSINIPHHHCCPKYTYHIPGNVHFSFYSFNVDKYLGRVSTHVRNSKFVNLQQGRSLGAQQYTSCMVQIYLILSSWYLSMNLMYSFIMEVFCKVCGLSLWYRIHYLRKNVSIEVLIDTLSGILFKKCLASKKNETI